MRINLKNAVRQFLRREQGTQFVELAIALPILLMLLGATAEFGRYYYQYSTLKNAVRAGARHACKWEVGASWTIPETQNMVLYGDFSNPPAGAQPILPGLQRTNVSVVPNGPGANNVNSVTVKIINYQYQPVFDLGRLTGITGLSMNIPVSPSVTMKQLFKGPVA